MDLSISPVDAAIVVAYMLATMSFGIWAGRGQASTNEYFLAKRSLPWWAVLLSIVATETSTVTFLSVPGITFSGGDFRFMQFALGLVVGRFLVVGLLLPGYFRGEITTAYELLRGRFGSEIQWLASGLFLVTRNLADGLRLYLTAIVLAKVTHLDMVPCIVMVGAVTITYTMLGGMRSVVWNDCIQFVVYTIGGLWALFVLIRMIPGGWPAMCQFGIDADAFRTFDLASGPTSTTITVASGVVGGAILCLGTHGADQMMVQRYLAAKGYRHAAWGLIGSGFVVFVQFALFLLIGVGLASFFSSRPDNVPLDKDEAFAAFIVEHLGVGVVGLTLAAIFSAAMSTLSSSLNASASAWVNDFLSPRPEDDDATMLRRSRRATIVFGLIQMGVAALAVSRQIDRSTVMSVLKIAGFTMGPILGLFLLANFVRRSNSLSAVWGFT